MCFTISRRLPRLHYFVVQGIEAHVDVNLIDLCSVIPSIGISLACGAPISHRQPAAFGLSFICHADQPWL
jgi:hypothetical protein